MNFLYIFNLYFYKNVIIIITDNGRGIRRNDWNNIFKPGFSTKKRGWGLGLSLTQRIVKEIHKGDVMVIDSSKKGTKIKLSLSI